MSDGAKNKARFISTLPNGSNLYARKNEVGGRTYFSDEVGGGVFVWDTALVDDSTLLAAMLIETTLQRRAAIRKQKLQRRGAKLEGPEDPVASADKEILSKWAEKIDKDIREGKP